MKKNLSRIIIISNLFLIIFGLSSFSKNNIKTVRGYIHVYGNEPFTFIGIQTQDKKEYTIIAADEVCKELQDSQGKLLEITGIITSPKDNSFELNMLKNGKIELIEWGFVK